MLSNMIELLKSSPGILEQSVGLIVNSLDIDMILSIWRAAKAAGECQFLAKKLKYSGNLDTLGQIIKDLVIHNLDHFEVVSEKLIKLCEGIAEITRATDNEVYQQALGLLNSIWSIVSPTIVFFF